MTYRDNIEALLKSDDSSPAEIVKENIYMTKYLIANEDYREITIMELMKVWGVQEHYDRMVGHLQRLARDKTNRVVVLQYDNGAYDANPTEQKLLYFAVTDNDGNHIIDGGVLFQNAKMSFHT